MKKASQISKILPQTLQTPLPLKQIARIELHHAPHSSGFPSTRAFLRKYIPPMRFYNPQFLYKSLQTAEKGEKNVKLVIFGPNEAKLGEIQPEIKQSPEEIWEKVRQIDQEQPVKAPEQ